MQVSHGISQGPSCQIIDITICTFVIFNTIYIVFFLKLTTTNKRKRPEATSVCSSHILPLDWHYFRHLLATRPFIGS